MEQYSEFGNKKALDRFGTLFTSPRVPIGNRTSIPTARTRPFLNGASSYVHLPGTPGLNDTPVRFTKLLKGGQLAKPAF